MSEQMSMAGTPEFERVALDAIPPVAEVKGADFKNLRQSIASLGMLVPVTLHKRARGYTIIAGRRRIAAARELGWDAVPAMVYDERVHRAFIPSATIAENAVRSDNLGADLEGVARLREQGLTIEAIANATGMPVRDVHRLVDMLELPPALVDGVRSGAISKTVAAELKKFTPGVLASTLEVFLETGKLTAADVREARSAGFARATTEMAIPDPPALGPPLREQIIAVLDVKGLSATKKLAEIEKLVRPNGRTEAER